MKFFTSKDFENLTYPNLEGDDADLCPPIYWHTSSIANKALAYFPEVDE